MSAAGRHYAIGVVLTPGEGAGAVNALRCAAARLDHRIEVADDPARLDGGELDFVLADIALPVVRRGQGPVFGIVPDTAAARRNDAGWVQQLLTFDGYVAGPESSRQWLRDLCSSQRKQPFVGFFEWMPERQFVSCQLEQVLALRSFRLCYCGDCADEEAPALLAALSDRPYLRRLPQHGGEADRIAVGTPFRGIDHSAQRAYAGFGGGVVFGGEHDDGAALRRLGEIVSVGAVAICPDRPWIRRYFGDSVRYYPDDAIDAAVQAIDGAVEQIQGDPRRAVAAGCAARRIFEENFSAEVMLRNAVGLYERWQSHFHPEDRASPAEASRRAEPPRKAPIALVREGTSPNGQETAEPPRFGGYIESGDLAPNLRHSLWMAHSLFAALPDKMLSSIAQQIAGKQSLAPVPNWTFGGFAEGEDLAAHVRHSLWMAAQARGGSLPVIVPWHAGTRLKLHLDNDLSRTLFSSGYFEPNEFALLDRILRPGMVFVDGGANEGVYTIFAAARVGPEGRVIAVEPSRREARRLRDNVALNRLRNIEVVEAALDEAPGSAELLIAEAEHAGQNTLGGFIYNVHAAGTEGVTAVTVDELDERYGLQRVDILKLDVEGAELRALSGASRCLAKYRPLIMSEVLPQALAKQGGSAAAVVDLLEDAGYALLAIDDATGQPVALSSDDALHRTNIIAVHVDRDWGLLGEHRLAPVP